jgi:hypothetical protein
MASPYPVRAVQRNLHHQLLRSGVLILAQAAAPECICEIVPSRVTNDAREVRWRCFSAKWTSAPTRGRSAGILSATKKFCAQDLAAGLLDTSIELFIGRWPT